MAPFVNKVLGNFILGSVAEFAEVFADPATAKLILFTKLAATSSTNESDATMAASHIVRDSRTVTQACHVYVCAGARVFQQPSPGGGQEYERPLGFSPDK